MRSGAVFATIGHVESTDRRDPSDEFEPLKELEGEVERLASHPRAEARRLHAVADEGESGSTPVIEIGLVASRVIPLVLLMIGVIFGVYYLARHWA